MAKRQIIKIDADKCNGCGLCVPNCPEGAIQMIDGKARLISDLFCDGLGACIGECPVGAIEIEEREAAPYDEAQVMENIIKHGKGTIIAHLKHLQEHGETVFLNQAKEILKEKGIEIDMNEIKPAHGHGGGCPGSKMMSFDKNEENSGDESGQRASQLRQWPVQLHLVSPMAPYFRGADLLLAADCVAFSVGDFHRDHLKGKSLAIACPKLDSDMDVYVDKLKTMIDEAKINTLTVMIMEVPCCSGLLQLAKQAASQAERKVPIKAMVVSLQGEIIKEQWV